MIRPCGDTDFDTIHAIINDGAEACRGVLPADRWHELDCPFGHVQRIMTGGAGGVANVHVVKITKGTPHLHTGYDEVYYVLSGTGTIMLGQETHPLRPGSVAVTPAGVPHSLEAEPDEQLEFVIFGTSPMAMDDERARPVKPVG